MARRSRSGRGRCCSDVQVRAGVHVWCALFSWRCGEVQATRARALQLQQTCQAHTHQGLRLIQVCCCCVVLCVRRVAGRHGPEV